MNFASQSSPSVDQREIDHDYSLPTAMIQDFPYPILYRDLKHKITWANSVFYKVSGFSLDQVTNLSKLPVIAESGDGISVCIRNKKPVQGVLTLRFPTGDFIWEEYISPVLDNKGDVTRTVSTYKDITSERHLKAESEKLKKRLEVVVQQNPMPIALVNLKFKILVVNEAFSKMSGIARDKLLTMSIKDFTLLDQSGEGLKVVIEQKKRSFGEVRVDFSGKIRLLQQYGIPISNERDELTNILIVYNDVTEERRERIEIEKLQQRSETIVQQNPMPILVVNPSFKILVSNTAFHNLSRLSGTQLSSMNLKDFRIIDQTGEGLKVVIEQKKCSFGEVEVEFSHEIRLLEQYGIPIENPQGMITNILIVYNDITEQRNLLNTIRKQTESLTSSTKEVGRTLSALSQGDFTTLVEIFPEDPLEQLKKDLNSTISALHDTLKDIVSSYHQIESAINDVAMGTNDLATSSEEVATITVNTSTNLSKQVEELEFASSRITDISASIEEIASTAQTVKGLSTNVGQQGDAAVILGNQAGDKMKIVEQISMHAVDEITDLNNKMQEIRKIVKIITDIANQTNLLALNAAIEAARAGDAGRGFAVVAGEVKNLASESKNTSNEIQESIIGIITRSEKTSDAMKQAYDEIISGIESVSQTTNAITEMVRDVKITVENISEVTSATENQAVATNNLTGGISNTMNILKKGVSNMDSLAALAEESSASTQEIAARESEIQQMTMHFQKILKRFTL